MAVYYAQRINKTNLKPSGRPMRIEGETTHAGAARVFKRAKKLTNKRKHIIRTRRLGGDTRTVMM